MGIPNKSTNYHNPEGKMTWVRRRSGSQQTKNQKLCTLIFNKYVCFVRGQASSGSPDKKKKKKQKKYEKNRGFHFLQCARAIRAPTRINRVSQIYKLPQSRRKNDVGP